MMIVLAFLINFPLFFFVFLRLWDVFFSSKTLQNLLKFVTGSFLMDFPRFWYILRSEIRREFPKIRVKYIIVEFTAILKRSMSVSLFLSFGFCYLFTFLVPGGFGMGGAGGMQMSAAQMQHQQLIRSQSGGMAGPGMTNSSQMQQLLSQQHQQQSLAMQQSNSQMSVQMQMSQSSSVNSVNSAGTGTSSLHTFIRFS